MCKPAPYATALRLRGEETWSHGLDRRDLPGQAELAVAAWPGADAVPLENHIFCQHRRLSIVMCQGDCFVNAEVAAVPVPHEGDHGAGRELETADEGAASAIDRPIGVAVATTLALGELAQEVILA